MPIRILIQTGLDRMWNILTIHRRYSLLVDDKDKQEKKRPSSAARAPSGPAVETFYFGGSPSSNLKNFTGCISSAYISRWGLPQQSFSGSGFIQLVNVLSFCDRFYLNILTKPHCIESLYCCRQDRDIEPEDFQRYTEKVQISLQGCPFQQRPPTLLLLSQRDQPARVKERHQR